MRKTVLIAAIAALTGAQALLLPAPALSAQVAKTVKLQQAQGAQGSDLQLALTLTPFSGDANECGSSTELEVNVGDQVNVCYAMTNNGSDTLAFQSITDSVDGAVLTFEPITLAPGQTHEVVRTIVASGDTVRTANWTGYVNLAGYTYDDTVTPNFIDISVTGTDVGFVAGDNFDNEIVETTAGFPLRFYGQTSTALCLSIDGLIQFADPDCIPPSGQEPPPGYSFNQDIPSTFGTEVPTYLAPMWMNIGDGPGSVYVQTLGTEPARKYIVQWNDLYSYANATSTATFEVVFDESSDTIRYEYATTAFGNEADNGAWATVGLQADPHGLYTKYSYYQASLRPDSAIQWNYTPAVGTSTGSNPAHLDAGVPSIALATASITAIVGPGETATRTLSIGNAGERDLHWNLSEAPGGSTAHFPKTMRHVKAPIEDSTPRPQSPFSAFAATHRAGTHGTGIPYAISGTAVPAIGTSTIAGLVGFDAESPTSTFSIISDDLTNWYYAVSFIGNDFSKLYAIVYDSWEYAPGTYGTIDAATGAFTVLGTIDGGTGFAWAGLTQDPLTGTVYAVNSDDGFNSTLYTLDLETGKATLVGNIDGPGVNASRIVPGIAISPDGLMYGIDLWGQQLLAIDKLTGEARVIESLGLNLQYFQDLEFDEQSGTLYWSSMYATSTGDVVGEMRTIDPATAASTATGTFPPTGGQPTTQIGTLSIAKPSAGCAAPGDVPWLSVNPGSGTIAAGADNQDVTVTLDSSGLETGLYQATLCIFSDDPQKPGVAVPVSFAINDAPLYDQNIGDTSLHAFNNTVVVPASITAMSSEGADDFVVDDANGWSVSGFNFSAYGNDGSPLPSRINLRIHADDGEGHPGAEIVCLAPNVSALRIDAANEIGVWLPSACDLSPGTYWVVWSFADVDLTTPVLGFWGQTTEQHNQPAVWRNPGGMLSAGCTEWSTFSQCPDQFDTTARDFGFTVFGTPLGNNPCADTVFNDGFDGGAGGCTSVRSSLRD